MLAPVVPLWPGDSVPGEAARAADDSRAAAEAVAGPSKATRSGEGVNIASGSNSASQDGVPSGEAAAIGCNIAPEAAWGCVFGWADTC